MWVPDLTWDSIGCNAGLYHLIWPLRGRIQVLARKHQHRPTVFKREFEKLLERYYRKVRGEPWFQWNLAQFSGYRERVERSLRESRSGVSSSEHSRAYRKGKLRRLLFSFLMCAVCLAGDG